MRRRIDAIGAIAAATVGGLLSALVLIAAGVAGNGAPDVARGVALGDLYRSAAASVAVVRAGDRGGSAFVVDGAGHLVTNAHVVGDASRVEVTLGGETRAARVVGVERSVDVAVLSLPGATAPPLAFEDTPPTVGEPVAAIGAPFGLAGSLSSGIVSGLRRQIDSPNGFAITGVIQTDAALNPGNSGGPVLSLDGRVIGVATQIATDSGRNEGIGFAIPAATVRRVADQIIATGHARLAYLGIVGQDVGDGILIAQPTASGPAGAVVRPGDLLVALDGSPIRGNGDLGALLAARAPGDRVSLTIERGASTLTLPVTLAARPPGGP